MLLSIQNLILAALITFFCEGHLSWLLTSPEFILFNLHLLWKVVLGEVWGKRGLCLEESGPPSWELNPTLTTLSVCNQVTETACVDCVFVLALFSAFLRENNWEGGKHYWIRSNFTWTSHLLPAPAGSSLALFAKAAFKGEHGSVRKIKLNRNSVSAWFGQRVRHNEDTVPVLLSSQGWLKAAFCCQQTAWCWQGKEDRGYLCYPGLASWNKTPGMQKEPVI